ncbi:hypothetical protein NPIL_32181 [Nephila pilipes]|uniref:Uncharacterized protein n=1 Tax=Nephila pilipes TaxID=299642 RepID=A0A8X6QI30_NEPPI|nr:hypothetical protein NPIL_32181 [Nephila pilipes]
MDAGADTSTVFCTLIQRDGITNQLQFTFGLLRFSRFSPFQRVSPRLKKANGIELTAKMSDQLISKVILPPFVQKLRKDEAPIGDRKEEFR